MTGFYNGELYKIEYSRELSNPFYYTKTKVYKIDTEEEKWGTCLRGIVAILTDNNIDCGISAGKHAVAKTIADALEPYHKMEWSDEHNCLLFTITTPYDD